MLGLCVLLAGCGTPMTRPDPIELRTQDMLPIVSNNTVALMNAQTAFIEEIPDLSGNLPPSITNLDLWAERAIVLIKQWLSASAVPVADRAERTLKVSISDLKFDSSEMPCTFLTMHVETGSGLKRNYSVKGCAIGRDRSAGYAINHAVMELMRDGSIIGYLSK